MLLAAGEFPGSGVCSESVPNSIFKGRGVRFHRADTGRNSEAGAASIISQIF